MESFSGAMRPEGKEREGHLLVEGVLLPPAPTVQLPPWPSHLAPRRLFEEETTRACAEAGC